MPALNLLRLKAYAGNCAWYIVLLLAVSLAGCNGNLEDLGGGVIIGAPIVTSVAPADGATDVAVNTTISATFSKPMDPSTIDETTFTVSPATGSVSLSANGLTAFFTPGSDLTPDTLYTATITTGARDVDGNALETDKVWSFTAGSASAPTVVSTSPADLDTDVAVGTTISATFSNDMEPSTLNTTTFTLTDGVTVVSGVVTYVEVTKTAFFNPINDLAAATTYTARVTTGATDIDGNALAASEVWSFTTQ